MIVDDVEGNCMGLSDQLGELLVFNMMVGVSVASVLHMITLEKEYL